MDAFLDEDDTFLSLVNEDLFFQAPPGRSDSDLSRSSSCPRKKRESQSCSYLKLTDSRVHLHVLGTGPPGASTQTLGAAVAAK